MLYDLVSYRLHCLVLFILVWLSGMLYQPVVHSLLYSAAIMLEAKACGSDLHQRGRSEKRVTELIYSWDFLSDVGPFGVWALWGVGFGGVPGAWEM